MVKKESRLSRRCAVGLAAGAFLLSGGLAGCASQAPPKAAVLPASVLKSYADEESPLDLSTVRGPESGPHGSEVWTVRREDRMVCLILSWKDAGGAAMGCATPQTFPVSGVGMGSSTPSGGHIEVYYLPNRVKTTSAKIPGLEAAGPHLLIGDSRGETEAQRVTIPVTAGPAFKLTLMHE